MDELTSALSVAFTPCGTQLLGGYTGSIRIFDVSRPGRDNMQRDSPSPRGTVSALACSPDHSGVYAAGTFDGCISCYSLHARETLVSLKHPSSSSQSSDSAPKRRRHVASVGITQLQFSPCARYLYSGARRDPFVICWDIRNTSQALCRFRRQCDNNQRIGFDIDSSGRYLCSASQSGRVAFFDLQQVGSCASDDADVPELPATFEIDTQCESGSSTDNVVNGVALHPFAPLLLLSRGARDFSSAPAQSARTAPAASEDAASDPSSSGDESASRVPPTGNSRIGFRAVEVPSDDDDVDQVPPARTSDRGTCEMWRLQPSDQHAWSTYLDAFP
jgi:WD40 repeat protein